MLYKLSIILFIYNLEIDENEKKYDIFIPKDKESGYVNNTKERYR